MAEIPDTIKGRIEIVPVKWIDQVLERALASQPQPLPETVDAAPVESTTTTASAAVSSSTVTH
jgi:ATP-dependent Lon protease